MGLRAAKSAMAMVAASSEFSMCAPYCLALTMCTIATGVDARLGENTAFAGALAESKTEQNHSAVARCVPPCAQMRRNANRTATGHVAEEQPPAFAVRPELKSVLDVAQVDQQKRKTPAKTEPSKKNGETLIGQQPPKDDAKVEPGEKNGHEAETDQVFVTGSRIRRNPLDEPAPLMVVSTEEIRTAGLTSLGDHLQQLPMSGAALNTAFSSSGNFGFPPDGGEFDTGTAQVDLRNLGSKRVLVLVDGLRWVTGVSTGDGASITDLNTIPISVIDRIEVLEDAPSAVYGSDAIAGVVNIITRKHFEGMELRGYAGTYGEGDGESQRFSASFGAASDHSAVFFSVSHANQEQILARNRAISSTPIPFVTDGTGGSSSTPQGRFTFNDPTTGNVIDCTINTGVSGIPEFNPDSPCIGDDFNPFDTSDRFNFARFDLLLAPSENTSVYGQALYDLAPETRFYVKALFNNRKSSNQAAPEPLSIGPDAGNGNLMDTVSIDRTNPFNPFGFSLSAAPVPGFDANVDGVDDPNLIFAGRRPLEGGPRVFSQDVNTWYIGGGLQGEFSAADRTFFWDANLVWSRTRADRIKTGGYNSARIKQALGPLDDCAMPCVPLNLFGGQGADGLGTITPAMLQWIAFTQKDVSGQEMVDITANITGNIVELPAGPLAFALGFEHREQDGFFQPDAVVVAGESVGVASSPTSGGVQSDEFYFELNVPVLEKVPGADLLDLSLAVRSSNYGSFGSDMTSKLGIVWQPTSGLHLRGTWGEGLRAPGIGELFGPRSRSDQTIDDPCSDMLGLSDTRPARPQTIIDNCVALGVPANGSYVQNNRQIAVTAGGNSSLVPEKADTVTLAASYDMPWADQLAWADQLQAEISYFNHELNGAIQDIDAQVQLQSCVTSLDPLLCAGIRRTTNGTINAFANQVSNIAGIETSGYDLSFSYRSPNTMYGKFSATWVNSFLIDYTEILHTSTGTLNISLQGKEVGDPSQAYPEWQSSLTVGWSRKNFSASLTWRYIDSVLEDCGQGAGKCIADAQNKLAATDYFDVQGTWDVVANALDGLHLTLGIDNIFDEDPPPCFSCGRSGFDATTYDLPGRKVYVRAIWRR